MSGIHSFFCVYPVVFYSPLNINTYDRIQSNRERPQYSIYIRISTSQQQTDRQETELKEQSVCLRSDQISQDKNLLKEYVHEYIEEKENEGRKTYTFEEYDAIVQERRQTDFFEPYAFDVR